MPAYARLLGGKLSTKSKVSIGIASSLPILSALQSIYFLRDYQINHRDAPRPISPSSGLAIVNPKPIHTYNQHDPLEEERRRNKLNSSSPLRLYVVGDSLAAGVGTSNSSTPILPESIARCLSLQLGGRPVYWFCSGRPGASANTINEDIQKHLTERAPIKEKMTSSINRMENFVEQRRMQFVKWKRLLFEWIQKRMISRPLVTIEVQADKPDDHSHSLKMLQSSSGTTYDVVVVLTGLNDLKGFFPFLSSDTCRNQSSFKEELRNIFVTLKGSMKKKVESAKLKQPWRTRQEEDDITPSTPMVVIPALPVGLVPLFQYPPLCWFSRLVFDFIDRQKKDLSQDHPGQILFVSPPTSEMVNVFEKSRKKLQAENVILLLRDVSKRTKIKIERMMKEYRNRHEGRKEDDDDDYEMEKNLEESIQHNLCGKEETSVGSTLISVDKVHPSDDGYEFWGRHIAEAIIQEWKIHDEHMQT